tara:strand:+ start:21 stop:983 length:963 start_codon:yes stop_codon:yes gene_type:complete
MAVTITTQSDVTFDQSASANDAISKIKALMPSIGLANSAIQFEDNTTLIYQITKGSGTYANTYMKIKDDNHSGWTYIHMTMGTGYDSSTNDITGKGNASTNNGEGTVLSYYNQYGNATKTYNVKTALASDGTFGYVYFTNDVNSQPEGSFGYIQPTNTAETAATIPLTWGIGGITNHRGSTFQFSSGQYGEAWNSVEGSSNMVNKNGTNLTTPSKFFNTRWFETATKKGDRVHGGLGHSEGSQYYYNINWSNAFQLQFNIGGNQQVVPNVMLFSGGVPVGYNSNLAYVATDLTVFDNIIVSSGSEEYSVISGDGIAVRTT